MNLYIISDTHFLTDVYGKINHTEYIIKNWKETVKDDDIVIHCGDICGPHQSRFPQVKHLIKDLPGHKILVKGNHDCCKNKTYLEVFQEVYDKTYIRDNIVYSHHPVNVNEYNVKYNIFGHFHNYPENVKSLTMRYRKFYSNDTNFTMCIWDWDWRLPLVENFLKKFI